LWIWTPCSIGPLDTDPVPERGSGSSHLKNTFQKIVEMAEIYYDRRSFQR
jgi:hypothetical protein